MQKKAQAQDRQLGAGLGPPPEGRGSMGHFGNGGRAGKCSRSSYHYPYVSPELLSLVKQTYIHCFFGGMLAGEVKLDARTEKKNVWIHFG